MFRHGYIFHEMLAEVGPLNDGKVRTHRSLQMIYGVNKPFRIRLDGKWQPVRLCLIDSGVDHFISGEDDWQICYFIYPDSHPGRILRQEILKGASVSILSQDENPGRLRTVQSAARPMSLEDVRGLFESFVYLFTGKRAYPRPGLETVQTLLSLIRGAALKELTMSEAAGYLGRDRNELAELFKRETELDPGTWMLHLRMMRFFESLDRLDRIPDDSDLERLARSCGIAGISGLDRLFEDFFGMPYRRWVNEEPGTVILTEQESHFLFFQ